MKIEFHRTGAERKELVKAISEILETPAVYQYMPTCAFVIGDYTVAKNGTLECDDTVSAEHLLKQLAKRGFEPETYEPQDKSNGTPPEESIGLTVSLPLDCVKVGNLTNLLDAKGALIRKALGVSDLRFELNEDTISFPWFSERPADECIPTYTKFIAALCKMTKKQKRIRNTAKDITNEKYAFRCFLLRLGFIGTEFKADRKLLLRNLDGSSAFKSGVKKEADNAVSE